MNQYAKKLLNLSLKKKRKKERKKEGRKEGKTLTQGRCQDLITRGAKKKSFSEDFVS